VEIFTTTLDVAVKTNVFTITNVVALFNASNDYGCCDKVILPKARVFAIRCFLSAI